MEMTISHDSIDQFLKFRSRNGSPLNTTKAYGADLKLLLQWAMERDLTTTNLEEVTSQYLTENKKPSGASYGPATIRRKKSAFRAYASFVGEQILTTYNTPKPPPGQPHPVPGGAETIDALVKAARRDYQKALIALGAFCGLRVSESVAVRAEDFDFSGDTIVLRVYGKGGKTRDIPVSADTWEILVPAWGVAVNVKDDTRLVPINNRGARKTITRIGNRIGIAVASHDLRSWLATMVYEQSNYDPFVTQELMGHASQDTTRLYTQINNKRKVQAVEFH